MESDIFAGSDSGIGYAVHGTKRKNSIGGFIRQCQRFISAIGMDIDNGRIAEKRGQLRQESEMFFAWFGVEFFDGFGCYAVLEKRLKPIIFDCRNTLDIGGKHSKIYKSMCILYIFFYESLSESFSFIVS